MRRDQPEEEGDVFAPLKLSKMVLDQVNQFKEFLPTIHILCNPGLRQRHWDQVTLLYILFFFAHKKIVHVHVHYLFLLFYF